MKKVYLIQQNAATFGQTGAGFHAVTGPERIVASASVSYTDTDAQLAFMAAACPEIILSYGIRVPIATGLAGFDAMVKALASGHRVRPFYGDMEIRLTEGEITLDKGRIEIDPINRAYQRALLS